MWFYFKLTEGILKSTPFPLFRFVFLFSSFILPFQFFPPYNKWRRERLSEKGILKKGKGVFFLYTFRQFEIKSHRAICLLKKLTRVTVYSTTEAYHDYFVSERLNYICDVFNCGKSKSWKRACSISVFKFLCSQSRANSSMNCSLLGKWLCCTTNLLRG